MGSINRSKNRTQAKIMILMAHRIKKAILQGQVYGCLQTRWRSNMHRDIVYDRNTSAPYHGFALILES